MRSYLAQYGRMALLPALLAGCAVFPRGAERAAVSPKPALISQADALTRVFSGLENAATAARIGHLPPADDPTTFTLSQIEEVARRQNPTFKEFAASHAAAQAEVLQALAYPNPEFEASLGIVTTREAPKLSALEYDLGLSQALEWPGKRKARRKASEALEPIVRREEDVFRATLRADVAKAYYTILYVQHAENLAKAALATEAEIETIVRRRVEGGEAPGIDLTKARVETLKASRAVQFQRRQRETARSVLNALAGRSLPSGFALADTLEQPLGGADVEAARQIALDQHPALRRLEAVLSQRELAIRRERKAWYPDLKLGLNRSKEIDTRGIGGSFGFELPFWNRNQGGIAAAQAELQKAQAELEKARQEVLRDLETGVQSYESAREQLAAFRSGLRAAAAESLRIETFLYQEGEADFLQLLDARRTARQTEAEYLQALYDASISRAELERAIGIGGNKE